MSRDEYIRAAVAIAASRLFPTTIRDAIISDAEFIKKFGVRADAIIRLGHDHLTFQRSALFDAIRQALNPAVSSAAADDTLGQTWRVHVLADKSPVQITLERETTRFLVSHFGLLSPDKDVRLATLFNEADSVCLSAEQMVLWRQLLQERAPSDDEVILIHNDLKDTPIAVAGIIRENLARGSVSLDVWVPRASRYYERLVGHWESGLSLVDYAKQVAPDHFKELLKWRGPQGLKLALLLTPQPLLSAALGEEGIGDDTLGEVISWLADKGDAMSRAAGMEIALARLPDCNKLREPLTVLFNAFAEGKPPPNVDPIKLLSCLIIVVYGEIADCRIHAEKPPFWRKLAAIAQVSLIAQCIADVGGDATELMDWLETLRSQTYLLQCFVDLRVEPRWLPDFAFPDQLRNEIYGRVWMARIKLMQQLMQTGNSDLVLGDKEEGLKDKFNQSFACLPGPLEGGIDSPVKLTAEDLCRIKDDLSAAKIALASVSILANAALLVHLPIELADMAGEAIARADYRLHHDNQAVFVRHLLGLASAAAVTRSQKLADALFVLLRTYRHFHPDEMTISDAFRIGIIACASRSELVDWCKCVGEFTNDFAFQQITTDEASYLYSYLVHLCHLIPELWATCGQGEAALRSVLKA